MLKKYTHTHTQRIHSICSKHTSKHTSRRTKSIRLHYPIAKALTHWYGLATTLWMLTTFVIRHQHTYIHSSNWIEFGCVFFVPFIQHWVRKIATMKKSHFLTANRSNKNWNDLLPLGFDPPPPAQTLWTFTEKAGRRRKEKKNRITLVFSATKNITYIDIYLYIL